MNIPVQRPASCGPAALTMPQPHIVAGRACGSCTLCCKVAAVEEVGKPMGVWCRHCAGGKACTIYPDRPASCRSFYCQWMLAPGLGDEWRPGRARLALVKTEAGHRLTALVDPGYPGAWRRSPYYENLKRWAVEAAQKWPELYLVDVMIGQRCIVILPDREIDVGLLDPGESVRLQGRMVNSRLVLEVDKVRDSVAAPAKVEAGFSVTA
jgi:hypothetical protein